MVIEAAAGQLRPKGAERAGMGIDHADADEAVRGKTEIRRRGPGEGSDATADRLGAVGQVRAPP